jgi:hypothetical protein
MAGDEAEVLDLMLALATICSGAAVFTFSM